VLGGAMIYMGRTLEKQVPSVNSPECVEGVSLLKKWLSAWSALKESPKTRLKRYENALFCP
jgi:hypothetical protein